MGELDEIDSYVRQSHRARLDAWLTKWAFRTMLIKRAYTREQFGALAAQSQFGECEIDVGPIGFEARLTKRERQRAAS